MCFSVTMLCFVTNSNKLPLHAGGYTRVETVVNKYLCFLGTNSADCQLVTMPIVVNSVDSKLKAHVLPQQTSWNPFCNETFFFKSFCAASMIVPVSQALGLQRTDFSSLEEWTNGFWPTFVCLPCHLGCVPFNVYDIYWWALPLLTFQH